MARVSPVAEQLARVCQLEADDWDLLLRLAEALRLGNDTLSSQLFIIDDALSGQAHLPLRRPETLRLVPRRPEEGS